MASGGVEVVVHPLVLLSTVDHYNRVLGETMVTKQLSAQHAQPNLYPPPPPPSMAGEGRWHLPFLFELGLG